MELGNASDVVSAGCNMAMAVAAIYAAWNARDWFSQKTHTKGFDKAEDILSSIDEYTLKTKKTVSETHSTFSLFEEIKQSRSVPHKKSQSKFNENLSWHSNYKNSVQTLVDDLFRLERWAIKVSNPGDILKVTNELINMHVSAAHFYTYCDSCLYQLHNMGWSEFDQQFKLLKTNYNDYLSSLAQLEKAYDKFKIQRFKHFFKLQ
ncbi:hypothetical protein [Pantoea dispersa]|uniref:hypothetical protein n=1 Tax=Pantoea dispersa TaxID=59814 RepID=UPI0013313157|nr:hypothetical protein [Pantoea dispersa]